MQSDSTIMKQLGALMLGLVIGVAATALFMRHNNSVIYDPTILAHIHEAILNAEQIRSGDEDEVLARIDAWLRGSQIEKSLKAFLIKEDSKDEAEESLRKYREKHEPVESAYREAQGSAGDS